MAAGPSNSTAGVSTQLSEASNSSSTVKYLLIPVNYLYYMASLTFMSRILSIMSTAQKHNRQNFEHNRPGPSMHSPNHNSNLQNFALYIAIYIATLL